MPYPVRAQAERGAQAVTMPYARVDAWCLPEVLTDWPAAPADLQVQAILNLNGSLNHEQACGGTPINGLLMAAAKHRLVPRLLGSCNSGDSAGDRQRVVGYASFAFEEVPNHVH